STPAREPVPCTGVVHHLTGGGRARRFTFFFQAEDGIRDLHVTGVQTCALPISRLAVDAWISSFDSDDMGRPPGAMRLVSLRAQEIGRASCRETVYPSAGAAPRVRQWGGSKHRTPRGGHIRQRAGLSSERGSRRA